jgi:uncharacterized protein (DUF697 family)
MPEETQADVEENVTDPESEELQLARNEEAKRIVSKYVGWSAGTGAIPFPVWDIVAITSVQIKMVKELLDLYAVPFSETKVKSSLSVLFGSLSPYMLAGITATSLFKFVPVVGHALAAFTLPMLSAAASYAVGKVMISHLASGGTLADFQADKVKDKFKQAFEEGKAKVKAATARKTTAKPANT